MCTRVTIIWTSILSRFLSCVDCSWNGLIRGSEITSLAMIFFVNLLSFCTDMSQLQLLLCTSTHLSHHSTGTGKPPTLLPRLVSWKPSKIPKKRRPGRALTPLFGKASFTPMKSRRTTRTFRSALALASECLKMMMRKAFHRSSS